MVHWITVGTLCRLCLYLPVPVKSQVVIVDKVLSGDSSVHSLAASDSPDSNTLSSVRIHVPACKSVIVHFGSVWARARFLRISGGSFARITYTSRAPYEFSVCSSTASTLIWIYTMSWKSLKLDKVSTSLGVFTKAFICAVIIFWCCPKCNFRSATACS